VWAGGSSLLAARRSGGGGWSKPTEVAPLDGHAEYELLAGRDGRTTVLWGAANGLMASTSTKLGEWSAPSLVAPAGSEDARISDVTVADDPSGNLVAVWLESTGTDQELAVRIGSVRRPAGEAWRGQRTLATTTGVVTKNLDLAVNRGGATVAWFQGNSDNTAGSVMTLSRSEQGWPARPTVLDDSLTAWTEPSLAAAAEDVMAVWSSGPDSGAYPVAARRSPSGRWGTPRPLATPKAAATHPRYYEAERSPLVVVPRSNMFTVAYQGSPNIKFRDYVDDRTPPSARIVPFADPYLHPAYDDVDFSVRDDQTGARNYDVRMRYVKRNGRLTNWALIARRTREATTYLEDTLPGRTYCFSVRARDRAGNLGPWSRSRCNTAAKDDRAASTTPGWTRTADRDAFRASLTTTRRHGQSLTLRGVTARRISLMARTCSSCGAVTVHHAGRYLGRLSLSTRSVQVSRVFPLRRYAKERTGPLVIRVVSRGKPVHIDGFIPRR
jgi:hypothetical protein